MQRTDNQKMNEIKTIVAVAVNIHAHSLSSYGGIKITCRNGGSGITTEGIVASYCPG